MTIRLRRMGSRNQPTFRVVVIDSRKARDGAYIESIGYYNPRKKSLELKIDRAQFWLSKGARASATAQRLIKRYAKLHSVTPTSEAPAPTAAGPEKALADSELSSQTTDAQPDDSSAATLNRKE
ncbi:MAG: 30S ribosomal protein S16 [candidate division WOR-3 bacterium]